MKQSIAFIGMGLMGVPMASRLVEVGHEVFVYNRTQEKCQPLVALGATPVESPRACAEAADIIMMCLTDEVAVEAVIFGENGILRASAERAITIIDHSTTGTRATRDIVGRLKDTNIRFIDAPVTGGAPGAKAGTLLAFCGGVEVELKAVESVMNAYCGTIHYLGAHGAGQAAKMCNQAMLFNSVYAIYEMLGLAKHQGIDMKKFLKCFDGSLFDSKVWQLIVDSELNPDFPKVVHLKTHMKDLNYLKETAEDSDSFMPITGCTRSLVERLMDEGFAEEDPRVCIKTLFD